MKYHPPPVKDLGVTVSPHLSRTSHNISIPSKARSVVYWVLSVVNSRENVTMRTLYKSLIRSHWCPLCHSSKVADFQELESVQRASTARMGGTGSLNYWKDLN